VKSRIAEELRLRFQPVAILFANERPEGATQFKEGARGCVIDMLTAVARGKTVAVFDRNTTGCRGAIAGLCFGSAFDRFPGGFEYFLSSGRGPGYPEGEGYKKSPDLVKGFLGSLPLQDIPYTYVVFKPLSIVDTERETPQLVTFYCNPDQLTAMVVLANYARPTNDNVIIPMAAGCQSVCLIPYQESLKEEPRAVVGLVDVSARPAVPPDILTVTVPYQMLMALEADVPGSFFERKAWQKVQSRLPEPNGP
jgi:uncharacterized protein (DUF169 family)